jgi:hypothetical protein
MNDEELQKKNFKFNSINELTEDDFPNFQSLKNLLIMIDGSLTVPFFKRDLKNNIIG